MTTATSARQSPSELQGQVLAEAARRMLPVLTSKLLAAVADRAEASIDALSDRLGDLAENGGSRQEKPAKPAQDDGGSGGGLGGMLATVATMALQQARAFLDLVVRLLAQAAAAARTAAERLRNRRAPEGIDDEPAQIEGADDELDDEYEDEDDEELADEDDDARAPAAV
jgi:hypothetical protein